MRRLTPLLALCLLALVPELVKAHPLPGAPNCPIFPLDNPWNQRVDSLPVAKGSAAMIARIGLGSTVHPGFGSGRWNGQPIGIPITVVSSRTRRVQVHFYWATQSNRRRYPIPRNVAIEGGPRSTGDRHVILVDRDTCVDYELFEAYPEDGGRMWQADSGAIFDLRSNHLRPARWTSADAAGLPILPGLVRYDEVKDGYIDHALRFTAPCTAKRFVYPARHFATIATCSGALAPPMGLRVRLKAGVNISRLPFQARVIAEALKQYGMILADNGPAWFVSGTPSRHWNDKALSSLQRLPGSDFEVVNTSSLPHPGL